MKIPVSHIIYKEIPIDIFRLDNLDDPVTGNKYFKLKYNIAEIKSSGIKTILTFGGAFSNHIHAVSIAGKIHNIKTIGIIRGQSDVNNPTLKEAVENGMHLKFIGRKEYQNKEDITFLGKLRNEFGDFYLLPEGGTNALAVKGCSEILQGRTTNYNYIFCAVGTGGTLAGLIETEKLQARVIGISVVKGDEALTDQIRKILKSENKYWEVNFNYHFGGYAKYNTRLLEFINWFYQTYSILLDPIYTGKTLFALFDMIDKNYFTSTNKILALHSGGLQGWSGWNYRFNK